MLLARAVITAVTVMSIGREAFAHKYGIASMGCDICHSGGKAPTVTLTASPMQPAAGEAVTLTVTISQANGTSAGFYLTTSFGAGAFKATDSGTTVISNGVGHTMPRTGSGGQTKFQAQWSSPTPAGVVFQAYGLSANGDGSNRGDGAGQATLDVVAGCGAGKRYYLDQDGDGYGTKDPIYMSVLDCATPTGYADNDLDCDDFHDVAHPGAAEICDGKDNDCNGAIDDGAAAALCSTGGTCQQGKCVGGSSSGGVSGSGGVAASGGKSGSGGLTASGGASGAGGVAASGGKSGSGGLTASGGGPGTGGLSATGGALGSGGISSSGGSSSQSGGTSGGASGGTSATTGGMSGSGGRGDDPDASAGSAGCAVGGPRLARSSGDAALIWLGVLSAFAASRRDRRLRPTKQGGAAIDRRPRRRG